MYYNQEPTKLEEAYAVVELNNAQRTKKLLHSFFNVEDAREFMIEIIYSIRDAPSNAMSIKKIVSLSDLDFMDYLPDEFPTDYQLEMLRFVRANFKIGDVVIVNDDGYGDIKRLNDRYELIARKEHIDNREVIQFSFKEFTYRIENITKGFNPNY